eukprot:scpid87205/ scgid34046/ 
MTTHLQWVVDAWDGISTDLIEKSFKACGITNDLHGLEDDQIHCFKPNGPIPDGMEVLKSKSSSHTISEPVLVPEEEHDEREEEMMVVEVLEGGESCSERESGEDDDDDD